MARRPLQWCAVALIAFASAGCDEDVFVKGIVRDPSGSPLEGVTVTFTSPGMPPISATTPTDGTFNVGIINAHTDTSWVGFEKQGFRQVKQTLDGWPQWQMDITLTPVAPP
jgi:hypothetical protein